MYNVDDAIAKIDGYVISISGGGPFVGERKLVRIDEVKRTAAYASMVSENGGGPKDSTEPEEAEEEPESIAVTDEVATDGGEAAADAPAARRRRGRRGGRRRSRARTGSGDGQA